MEAIVINKSQIDSREYSYHKLGNALRVLFVSDPQSAKVAVSLSVAVGTMNDPADCPGLAHYCEHMLFMGTHDHPAENAFDEFLSKNGGSTNADTEQNMTHYYFDCAATSLVPALELFTGFFVCPLFSQTAAVKEVDAIDAEFSSIKKDDNCRVHWLWVEHLNKGNPIIKAGHGTREQGDTLFPGHTQSCERVPRQTLLFQPHDCRHLRSPARL